MTKENWGKPGMPPVEYDVVGRQVIHGEWYDPKKFLEESDDAYRADQGGQEKSYKEVVYLHGEVSHLGFYIDGATGRETVVVREIRQGNVVVKYDTDLDVQLLREKFGLK